LVIRAYQTKVKQPTLKIQYQKVDSAETWKGEGQIKAKILLEREAGQKGHLKFKVVIHRTGTQ